MKRLALFGLALLVASNVDARDRRCRPNGNRLQDSCAGFAFFEFAPASGAGMPAACSTTAPTGARGEVLAATRASAATCTKGTNGLRSTAINDGDLVSLSTNVMRVELDADGVAGLLVEAAASPITIQSRPICNAAWADVGTPACTADSTTGPWGTVTMGRLTDDAAGAKEGRSQTMATTSATRFTAYCYVKDSDVGSATITLAGTGNAAGDCTATITGLSGTTSSIIECTSAVAYTGAVTAVTVSILVGDDVADQGRIFVEGCNVVPSATYRTSFTDAAAVTVARAAETATFTLAAVPGTTGCAAGTHSPQWTGTSNGNSGGPQIYFGSTARALQGFNNSAQAFDGTNNPVVLMSYVAGVPKRVYSTWSPSGGWLIRNVTDAAQTTSAFSAAGWAGTASTTLCLSNCGAFYSDGIVNRLVYDPTTTHPRCLQ